jgi:ribonuclease P protein component
VGVGDADAVWVTSGGEPVPAASEGVVRATVVPARAGFVVSKAVGNAVVRNRVRRRLRHLVRPLLADLPDGATLVVRALPAAAGASFATLAGDLESALVAARKPRRQR